MVEPSKNKARPGQVIAMIEPPYDIRPGQVKDDRATLQHPTFDYL